MTDHTLSPPSSFKIKSATAFQGIINVSRANHIKGCATAGNCYDQQSASPVSDSIEVEVNNRPVISRAEAGNLEVYTMAGGFSPVLKAEATSSVKFLTLFSFNLNIGLFVKGSDPIAAETGSTLLLTNLTSGAEILKIRLWQDYMPPGGADDWLTGYEYNNNYYVSLEDKNEYELSVYSVTTSSEDGWENRTRIELSHCTPVIL